MRKYLILALLALTVAGGVIAFGADWRAVFTVGGVAPLVLAGVMVAIMPESARFLTARQVPPGEAAARLDLPTVLFGGGRARTTLLLWTA